MNSDSFQTVLLLFHEIRKRIYFWLQTYVVQT